MALLKGDERPKYLSPQRIAKGVEYLWEKAFARGPWVMGMPDIVSRGVPLFQVHVVI